MTSTKLSTRQIIGIVLIGIVALLIGYLILAESQKDICARLSRYEMTAQQISDCNEKAVQEALKSYKK